MSPEPKRIVVVDDNDLMRRLLKASLAAGGYEVVTAASGWEAVARMREQTPDLALVDLQMPELDGLGTLRKMLDDPRLKQIPVVAITAFFHPQGRDEALAAGFRAYLTKPIARDQLLHEVARCLTAPAG